MPRQSALRIGEGARCSVLLSRFQPSKRINKTFLNKVSGQRLTDLKAVRVAWTTQRGNVYDAVFFHPNPSRQIVLRLSLRCHRRGRAPGSYVGGTEQSTEAASTDAISERMTGDPINISAFAPTGNHTEDIAAVRNQGLAVDDDNEPAPENIPATNTQSTNITQLKEGQTWG
mmetsp:Transcript_7828/g.16981  ORF Transcript_7828/g.16981 Transcript_7828/m.16981 type:complete len:172 (+) Transcript_7828:87-602(+)